MTNQNFASPLSPRRRRSIWTRLTRSIHGSLDWNSAPPLSVGLREGFAEIMGRGADTQEEGRRRREGGREGRRTYVPPTVEEEEEQRGRERERSYARRGGVDEGRPQEAAPPQNERTRYGSRPAQAPPRQVPRQEGGHQGDRQGEEPLALLESALSTWAVYEDPRGGPSLATGLGPTVRPAPTAGPGLGLSFSQGTHHTRGSAPAPAPAPVPAPTPANAPTSAYPNTHAAAPARPKASASHVP